MASKKQIKADRRAEAQARAEALRRAQSAKERRTRLGIVIGAVVLVALVAISAVLIVQQAGKSPIDKVSAKPANSDAQGGFNVTEAGALRAPGKDGVVTGNQGVVMDVYYDYMCHWCAAFENMYMSKIDELRKANKVTVVLHPINTLSGGPSSPSDMAGRAVAEVADKDPAHFYAFHEALFKWQYEQMGRPTDKQIINTTAAVSYTAADLQTIAKSAGVSQAAMDAFSSATFEDWLTASKNYAMLDTPKLSGTPAVYLRQAGKPFKDAKVWNPSYTDLSDLGAAVADVAAGKTPPPVSTAIPVPETTPSVSQGTPAASPEATK